MPTTSIIGGDLHLFSIGAVTSTFTAPESCTTPFNLQVAGGFADNGPHVYVGEECSARPRDNLECLPHGDDVAAYFSSVEAHPPPVEASTAMMYFSPAYACPAGWETAGVAAMSDGTASINGVFSPTDTDVSGTATPTASFFPSENFVPNMITSALGPDETAIICCPSGYELAGTDCLSSFSATELAGSTGCFGIYTGNVIYSDGVPNGYSSSTPPVVTKTWEFDGQTTTQTIEGIGSLPSDYYEDMAYAAVTFGDDGRPTVVDDNGGNYSDSWWVNSFLESYVRRDDMFGNWTGFGIVPALVMINNGTDREASAGSSTTATLWAVGSALLAGFVAVAAL